MCVNFKYVDHLLAFVIYSPLFMDHMTLPLSMASNSCLEVGCCVQRTHKVSTHYYIPQENFLSCRGLNCVLPNSHVKTLNPSVTRFADKNSKKVINVKWAHKCGILISEEQWPTRRKLSTHFIPVLLSPSLFPPPGHTPRKGLRESGRNEAICKPGGSSLTRKWTAKILTLDFSEIQNWEISYFVMVTREDW